MGCKCFVDLLRVRNCWWIRVGPGKNVLPRWNFMWMYPFSELMSVSSPLVIKYSQLTRTMCRLSSCFNHSECTISPRNTMLMPPGSIPSRSNWHPRQHRTAQASGRYFWMTRTGYQKLPYRTSALQPGLYIRSILTMRRVILIVVHSHLRRCFSGLQCKVRESIILMQNYSYHISLRNVKSPLRRIAVPCSRDHLLDDAQVTSITKEQLVFWKVTSPSIALTRDMRPHPPHSSYCTTSPSSVALQRQFTSNSELVSDSWELAPVLDPGAVSPLILDHPLRQMWGLSFYVGYIPLFPLFLDSSSKCDPLLAFLVALRSDTKRWEGYREYSRRNGSDIFLRSHFENFHLCLESSSKTIVRFPDWKTLCKFDVTTRNMGSEGGRMFFKRVSFVTNFWPKLMQALYK